ncbi:unnamed protein product, partial [Linum tenue]
HHLIAQVAADSILLSSSLLRVVLLLERIPDHHCGVLAIRIVVVEVVCQAVEDVALA